VSHDDRSEPGHLLLLTSNFPRWSGDDVTPFILHLAQDLQALDWRVDVLAPHAGGAARHEVLDGVPVRRFRYMLPDDRQRVAYGGGALMNVRRSRLVAAQVPLLVAAQFHAARRLLATEHFDVVQSHWVLPQGAVGSLVARPAGVPHLVTVHGSDVLGLSSTLLTGVKRRALLGAQAVTANSSATEHAVRRLVGDQRPVYRVPMGITVGALPSADLVARHRAASRRGEGPLLVFVGRLVDWKGVDQLIDAVALLAKTLPDVTCAIAGTGPERASLQHLAEQRGVADRLHWLGWLEGVDVRALQAAADVIVVPSVVQADGTTEGQGLTLLEGMASGTPVVGSAVGGIPDSLTDNEHGLLVQPGRPDAIATAVRRLTADPALTARLTAAARHRATEEFSRARSARRFDDVLQQLTSGARGSSRGHRRFIRQRGRRPTAM